MIKKSKILESVEKWVREFNAIEYALIEESINNDIDNWVELTWNVFVEGDYVAYNKDWEQYEVMKILNKDEVVIIIEGVEEVVLKDDLEWEPDSLLPMWGTLWTFGEGLDEDWARDNLEIMKKCGFRVYEYQETGTLYFGIDGAGCDFYEHHWIPLYIKRGLQWHNLKKSNKKIKKGEIKMFDMIKKEESRYEWERLDNMGNEEKKYIKKLQQKIIELDKEISNESDWKSEKIFKLKEKQEKLINELKFERIAEIIYLAYENSGGICSGHIFLDPDNPGELKAFCWTGNTYLSSESNLIPIYTLFQGWINNNDFVVEDIIIEEEWEKLQEKYNDKADFLDVTQLESIGVDYDTRMIDYLRWCLEG